MVMTVEEKAVRFDRIQERLWDMALHGHLFQSTIAAILIRDLAIPGQDGEDPEEA